MPAALLGAVKRIPGTGLDQLEVTLWQNVPPDQRHFCELLAADRTLSYPIAALINAGRATELVRSEKKLIDVRVTAPGMQALRVVCQGGAVFEDLRRHLREIGSNVCGVHVVPILNSLPSGVKSKKMYIEIKKSAQMILLLMRLFLRLVLHPALLPCSRGEAHE
jgi:hypothetical protein